MLRISRETDYSVVLMSRLAASDAVQNARDLSAATRIALPTVSKILKILARGGLLASQRGAKGGYTLARSADEISVAEIIHAVEGPIALTDCVDDTDCTHLSQCPVQGNWNRINRAIQDTLENMSLLEMTQSDNENQPTAIYV